MSSSLSSVVSNLVRATVGSSVSSTVTDEDLDRHVAELILKEAKKKAEYYKQHGVRAYLPKGGMSDGNVPRTNKRFLSSIIRSTDDHNRMVLRAQALAAQEVKREREAMERRERRARAEEAAAASAKRRKRLNDEGSSQKSRWKIKDEENWDRWDGRTADRNRKQRTWETWDGEEDGSGSEEERRHRRKRRRHGSRSSEVYRRRDEERWSEEDRDGSVSYSKKRSRAARSQSPIKKHSGRRDSSRRSKLRAEERTSSSKRKTRKSRGRSPSLGLSDEMDSFSDYYNRRPRQTDGHDSHRSCRRRMDSSSPSSGRYRSTSTETSRPRTTRRPRSLTRQSDDLDDEHASQSEGRWRSNTISEDQSTELRAKLKPNRDKGHLAVGSLKPSRTRSTSLESRSRHHLKAEASSSRSAVITRDDLPSRSPTPGPRPAIQPPSKMDKYFEESYDPRLDVAPLSAPKVPATGLIDNAEFEGWDAMLELLRIRREDKEEKKRMERLGLGKEKIKNKRVSQIDPKSVAERWAGEGVNIMEIQYKKKGSVREWDLGKKDF